MASAAWPRVVARSELYDVVGVARGDRLTIWLDRAADNTPVVDAALKVAVGEDGAVVATPQDGGTYAIVTPSLSFGGAHEVVFEIAASAGRDLLVSTLTVPAAPARHAPDGAWIPAWLRGPLLFVAAAFGVGLLAGALARRGGIVAVGALGVAGLALAGLLVGRAGGGDADRSLPATPMAVSDAPRRLSDGSVFLAKASQHLLDVRTVPMAAETVRPAIKLVGKVIGDPNRTGVVQSIQGGRVIALESGLPRIGQAVTKGEVLAQVDPHLPLADRTTIAERAAELDQLIALAEARGARLRPLAERGATPQGQVIDIDAELRGLRKRREMIRNVRAEPELLRAPTDGVIALSTVVPGQVVQPQDPIFQLVDPNGLWIELLAYGDTDPAQLTDAVALLPGGQTLRLSYRGTSRALQQQATVAQFAIVPPLPTLSVGQPVTVIAQGAAAVTGMIVPRDAVVRSANGETLVWRHFEPERFEAVPVRVRPLDGAKLVVEAGLAGGDRVVVRSAELVNQIR